MHTTFENVARTIALAACTVMIWPHAASSQNDGKVTTVILVRHAEKQSEGDDPSLTAAGKERALALVHVLGEMDVAAVYSTPYARTRETAQPLATGIGSNRKTRAELRLRHGRVDS